MKTNSKVLNTVHERAADESTSISEYMLHAEMCDEWAGDRLYDESTAHLVGQILLAEERQHQEFSR